MRAYLELLEATIVQAQGAGLLDPSLDATLAALFLFAGASVVLDVYGEAFDVWGSIPSR